MTYWNFDYVPVIAESGKVEQILVVAVNITDLVENRKYQEFLTARFRTTVNSVIESLITIGPDGKLLEINPAAFRFLHIPPDQIHKHYSSLSSFFELKNQEGKLYPRKSSIARFSEESRFREVMVCQIQEDLKSDAMRSGATFSINSENTIYAVINITTLQI
jgi:PAS domain-containing protein